MAKKKKVVGWMLKSEEISEVFIEEDGFIAINEELSPATIKHALWNDKNEEYKKVRITIEEVK